MTARKQMLEAYSDVVVIVTLERELSEQIGEQYGVVGTVREGARQFFDEVRATNLGTQPMPQPQQ